MSKWIDPYALGVVDVRMYGAKGDGTTSDTTAVQAAAAAATAASKALYFPPGNYVCSPNLDMASPVILGAGAGKTTITLGSGQFFIDANQLWSLLHVQGITFSGGKGAIRNRYTGTNVAGLLTVTDCEFKDYTGAAISAEASDMPLWHIERNLFRALDDVTSVGVALPGLTDCSTIRANEFDRNLIHIKLGLGGNNAYITENGFVQFNAATGGRHRAHIWVVPNSSFPNSGAGMVAADNKFGNENMGVDDFRTLYADEGTGTYFGDRLPALGADSTGYVSGHTFRNNVVNGGGSWGGNPFIYSTTPRVYGCAIDGLIVGGTAPSYLFQARTAGNIDPEAASNFVSFAQATSRNLPPITVTNQTGMFQVHDPGQLLDAPTASQALPGGARATAYVKLLQHRIGSFSVTNSMTLTPVTDAAGGTDAVSANLSVGWLYDYPPASALLANTPVWIEFDLKQGATSPLSDVYLEFRLDSVGSGSAGNFLRRWIKPTANWRSYRFLTASPIASNTIVTLFNTPVGATGTNVQIGRVRTYHAREPVLTDLMLPDVTTTTTAPSAGGAGALPATPAGYVTVYVNGTPRKLPYY